MRAATDRTRDCAGIVFLTGFRSDMAGTKASFLDEFCTARGIGYVRFDYSGHGASSGRFEDCTVGRWKDESDLTVRAQKLRADLALEALLVTRSEEGMTLFTDEGAWSVPAQAREVFDVSGAGDTVIGVLALTLASGASLRDAVATANRAGGIVVGKFGTSTVSYDELFGQAA